MHYDYDYMYDMYLQYVLIYLKPSNSCQNRIEWEDMKIE